MKRRGGLALVAVLGVLWLVRASSALFHIAVIDEVMTSYGGDPSVQFIEIRMLAPLQNISLQHSIFAAFDSTGTYVGDILEVPGNVPNSGTDLRWLVGTAAFQTASGLTPDFIMPAGVLPTGGGMVCYGGGPNVLVPINPPTWDRNDFANYVDCVAYGTYSGTVNALVGAPTPLNGDGHSLQRTSNTKNNAADFSCGDPATPENNASQTVSLPATTPCGACPAAPDAGCVSTFTKGLLLAKETGKQKLVAKLIGGPALAQTDLGNPLNSGGTAYQLCVYDAGGALAGQLSVNRAGDTCGSAPCWKALGGDPPSGNGYLYKDTAESAAGVFKIVYKSDPKSKALVRGRGPNLPTGIAAALQSSTSATVQLRGSDAPKCLSVTLTDIKRHDPDFFKAKQ